MWQNQAESESGSKRETETIRKDTYWRRVSQSATVKTAKGHENCFSKEGMKTHCEGEPRVSISESLLGFSKALVAETVIDR